MTLTDSTKQRCYKCGKTAMTATVIEGKVLPCCEAHYNLWHLSNSNHKIIETEPNV